MKPEVCLETPDQEVNDLSSSQTPDRLKVRLGTLPNHEIGGSPYFEDLC